MPSHIQVTTLVVLIATAYAAPSPASGQTTRCVDDDAPLGGNGLTWNSAYRHLQDALFEAGSDPSITEIRVAGGIYHPDQDEGGHVTPAGRAESFCLLDGVALCGGYRGLAGGGDPNDRDVAAFETVLSGDIGLVGQHADNSYHVVTADATAATAELDGCTVADGRTSILDGHPAGAGVYIVSSSPILRNCTIRDNHTCIGGFPQLLPLPSGPGGGLYCESGAPTLIDCLIRNNRTHDGRDGWAAAGQSVGQEPGGNGAGLFFLNSTPTLIGCAILDNQTGRGGHAADCDDLSTAAGASGGNGAGVCLASCYAPSFTDCTIAGNSTRMGGHGGVAHDEGGPGGDSGAGGGVCLNDCDEVYFVNCTLSANHTADGTTGVYAFSDGGAGGDGGNGAGFCLVQRNWLRCINCKITDNRTGNGGEGGHAFDESWYPGDGGHAGDGAGIYAEDDSSVNLVNCLVADNRTGDGGDGHGLDEYWYPSQGGDGGSGGGAYGRADASFSFHDGTIAANVTGGPGDGLPEGSPGVGGGVSIDSCTRHCLLGNCVVWGNESGFGSGMETQIFGPASIHYSCVQGWPPGSPDSGNLGASPNFVDPVDRNYRLAAGSPCIDAARNGTVPPDYADLDGDHNFNEPTPFDLDGSPRFADDPGLPDAGLGTPPIVDMGAYEFQGQTCFGDLDGDGQIGLADLAVLLANYATTSGAVYPDGDLDRDGDVDLSDLATLLAIYGTTCP